VVIRTSFGAWNFYAIRVQALDSSFNEIWQRRSIQGRPTAGYWTSGSEVDLGVPGLNAGATNYIRVAMEDSAGHPGSSFQQCKATAVVREDTGDPGQMKAERGKWGRSTDDGTVFWIGGFWAGDQSQ
jgi:hypothetical protein